MKKTLLFSALLCCIFCVSAVSSVVQGQCLPQIISVTKTSSGCSYGHEKIKTVYINGTTHNQSIKVWCGNCVEVCIVLPPHTPHNGQNTVYSNCFSNCNEQPQWHAYPNGNCTGTCNSLPITLVDFTATKGSQSTVLLKWKTVAEANNTGFDIERSTDAITWESIGFVATQAPGGNSTTALQYQYTDNNNLSSKTQYRLKQIDIDGKATYSLICLVTADKQKNSYMIYPNPSIGGEINVVFSNARVHDVSLTDLGGRPIKEWKSVSKLQNKDHITPGFYVLTMIDVITKETNTEKIVVQ